MYPEVDFELYQQAKPNWSSKVTGPILFTLCQAHKIHQLQVEARMWVGKLMNDGCS